MGIARRSGMHWMCCTGIWAMQVWTFCFAFAPDDGYPDAFAFLNKQTTLLVALLVVAFVYGFVKPRSLGSLLDWPVAIATSAGTLMCTVSLVVGNLPYLAVGGIMLSGAGAGWSYLRWGYLFSRFDTRSVLAYAFIAGAIASVGKGILQPLPEVFVNGVCIFLPLVSVLLLKLALRLGFERPKILYFGIKDMASLWRLALCVFVFSLACSLINVDVANRIVQPSVILQMIGRVIEIVVFFVMLYLVFVRNASLGFPQLWAIVFLFSGLALFLLLVGELYSFAYMFIGIAINLIVYYVWVALADISHHSDIHPYIIFSIGWSIYALPRAIRSLCYSAFVELGMINYLLPTVLMAQVIVVCYLLGTRNPYIQRIFSDLCDDEPLSEKLDTLITQRCESVVDEYGLTKRESEILLMLCKGRTKSYIAETLFVTENTVKGHTKRLYKKLHIHNRQELLSLVEKE